MVYRLRFLFMILYSLWEPVEPVTSLRRLSFFPLPLMDTDMKRMFTHSYISLTALGRWHIFSPPSSSAWPGSTNGHR